MLNAIKTILVGAFIFVFVTACVPDQATMIKNAKQAIVVVVSEKTTPTGEMGGLGTGFFVKENYIFTARHVIADSKKIQVALEDSEDLADAEVVYDDALTDVAVLKIKDWAKFKNENTIRYLPILSFDEIQPYTTVYSIGHPWGLFYSVSKGIISTDIRKKDSTPRWYIQTDAHVYEGNSGGPLITERGEVIGINDMMVAKTGGSYGLAIPMPLALKVINDLEKYKEVRWATIGVSLNKNTIKEMDPKGAAIESGLLAGDEIASITTSKGSTVVSNAEQLIAEMTTIDYSEIITLEIIRDGKYMNMQVKPHYKTNYDVILATQPSNEK